MTYDAARADAIRRLKKFRKDNSRLKAARAARAAEMPTSILYSMCYDQRGQVRPEARGTYMFAELEKRRANMSRAEFDRACACMTVENTMCCLR